MMDIQHKLFLIEINFFILIIKMTIQKAAEIPGDSAVDRTISEFLDTKDTANAAIASGNAPNMVESYNTIQRDIEQKEGEVKNKTREIIDKERGFRAGDLEAWEQRQDEIDTLTEERTVFQLELYTLRRKKSQIARQLFASGRGSINAEGHFVMKGGFGKRRRSRRTKSTSTGGGYIVRRGKGGRKSCVRVVKRKGKDGRMRRMVRSRTGKMIPLRKGQRVYKTKAMAKKAAAKK